MDDDNLQDDNVVYLFLVPDINKRKKTSDNYFTIPLNLFKLTPTEKNKIYELIEQSGQKILTVVNKIIDPTFSKYVMFVNITAYEGFNKDSISQQVITKCSEYFLSNRRRDRIPKSDIIAVLESIEGIDSVNIYFVSENNENFKKNPANAAKPDIGIDSFGDIIMKRGELAVIRGGWTDRNGQYFRPGIDSTKPSTLNITYSKNDTPKNLSMELHRVDLNKIKNTRT
jgi:hypothetical protein